MQPSLYIGADVGGTFTDLVLADTSGEVHVLKVPSVPSDPGQGVLDGLDRAAAELGVTARRLLARCALFVHGATVATNTVLEGKGAKVGLLATDGFRDSLQIRRGYRTDPFDHRAPWPPVLVPRHLRLPLRGRIGPDGAEVTPLSREDVATAAAAFEREGVEAVAICLFNSFLDATHEHAALSALHAAWSGEWACASSDIAPVIGEYERTSTAVMNAYVAPRTVGYLRRLDSRLRERGLARPMLLIQNNGGAVSVDQLANRPVTLLLSGPAAGVGALELYRRSSGTQNLISMEIGGTSCDVMLMSEGTVSTSDSFCIGGYDLAVPSVDIFTIGAGGGTIAGVDAAGMLFVGPRGAGADPGPACYGLGGAEPTVTDAQVVLGRLRAGTYAGGSMTVDVALARAAVQARLAAPLGIGVEEAASGIIRLVEQQLLQAVQQVSSERGHDPRGFTLVAAGGAGPMHGAVVARRLGCAEVYVPRLSGVFCALGMLHTDVRHDFVHVHLARLEDAQRGEVARAYGELEARAARVLEADGFARPDITLVREMDVRYHGQQYDVRVVLDAPAGGDAYRAADVRRAFEREHERRFGHVQPEGLIDISKLRVVAIGRLPSLALPQPRPRREPPAATARRRVWVDESHGWAQVDVFEGADLGPGQRIEGPALVEEATTTVLVAAGDVLGVDAAGNFRIRIGSVAP